MSPHHELSPNNLLVTARRKFPTFYLLSKPVEETALDNLVIAHSGLTLTVKAVRS